MRNRIYDYAFGGNVLHVHDYFDEQTRKYRHELSICRHTRQEGYSQRIKRQWASANTYHLFTGHKTCTYKWLRKPLSYHLPLALLRVCRQIYHEAVLKPFSETTFNILGKKELCARAFFEALVPTQIRAIKRLQFVSKDSECPAFSIMRQLSGVEYFDIELVAWCAGRSGTKEIINRLQWLHPLTQKLNHTFVNKLDLKRLSVTMIINQRIIPPYTKAEGEVLMDFMDRAEKFWVNPWPRHLQLVDVPSFDITSDWFSSAFECWKFPFEFSLRPSLP